jgi:hypothetical protein
MLSSHVQEIRRAVKASSLVYATTCGDHAHLIGWMLPLRPMHRLSALTTPNIDGAPAL